MSYSDWGSKYVSDEFNNVMPGVTIIMNHKRRHIMLGNISSSQFKEKVT